MTRPVRALFGFGRSHRRALLGGVAGALGVVLCRLALPWPLRGIVELVQGHAGRRGTVLEYLPSRDHALEWLLGAYVGLAIFYGLAEMASRIGMARFVSRTVRDLRARALATSVRRSRLGSETEMSKGELVARFVADTALLKTNLKGIFVHVAQNGLLFVAICVLFVFISPEMTLFLLAGGAVAIVIGVRTAGGVESAATVHRDREGRLAARLAGDPDHAGDSARNAADPAEKRRGTAWLITLSSLGVHSLFGVTVAVALGIGVHQVQTGDLTSGELFLFIAYALTVHRRLVQVGRQLARVGKVRASLARLLPLMEEHVAAEAAPEPLRSGLGFDGIRLPSVRGKRPRLDTIDLTLAADSRVLVLGKPGDGKSSLLRVVAGRERSISGSLSWDGAPLTPSKTAAIGFLPQAVTFPRMKVWEILGLAGPAPLEHADLELLEKAGTWKVVRRFPKGLEQKVASHALSPGEARALALGAILLGRATLWVLDAPLDGLAGKSARRRRLEAILSAARGRTLVMSHAELEADESFDRVIVLRRGRIGFDGTPLAWRRAKEAPQTVEEAVCKP